MYFKKYTSVKDSFINEDKYKEIANREFEYQKQKDDEMAIFEKELSKKELIKQKQIRNVIFGAPAILLLFLLVVLKGLRRKKKRTEKLLINKVIEEKIKTLPIASIIPNIFKTQF